MKEIKDQGLGNSQDPQGQTSHLFFLVVPPSFEQLAEKELRLKWESWQNLLHEQFRWPPQPFPHLAKVLGGIEVRLPLIQGLLLNILLKIPTRILLRISEFKCRDFP